MPPSPPSTGIARLRVWVTTARQAIPIEGARVVVTQEDGSEQALRWVLTTDQDGNTEIVELPAVPAEYSQRPGGASSLYLLYHRNQQTGVFHREEQPRSSVRRGHGHPAGRSDPAARKYGRKRNRSAGRNHLQRIRAAGAVGPARKRRHASFHSVCAAYLCGRKDYHGRRTLYPGQHYRSSGPPGSNAQNVTVTFPEYIKNVASSEIYPTWPENAIRANIYAQISFALNRYYTEWYRSQGYDYDITNSTAYDQSYVHGRDIYDNINTIVAPDLQQLCPPAGGASSPTSPNTATAPPSPVRDCPSGEPSLWLKRE